MSYVPRSRFGFPIDGISFAFFADRPKETPGSGRDRERIANF
jgi:hypothetical protein